MAHVEFWKTSLKAVSVTKTDTTPGDGLARLSKCDLPVLLNGMEYGYSGYISTSSRAYSPQQVLLQDKSGVMLERSALSHNEFKGAEAGLELKSSTFPTARWFTSPWVYREGSITFFMDVRSSTPKGTGVVSTPTGGSDRR
jgi:hypothetical protein